MYKTVRKGDASLQYTILPQTDQFPNGVVQAASSKPRPRVVRYTMGALMVLIILSCVATPFLMNQNDHNLFAATVLAVGRVEHGAVPATTTRNASRGQSNEVIVGRSKGRTATMTTTPGVTSTGTQAFHRKDLDAETTVIALDMPEMEDVDEIMSTDSFPPTTQRARTTSDMPMSIRQTLSSTTSSLTSVTSSSIVTRSSTSASSLTSTTESTKTASSVSRKVKMPRVTLKLRENETIPQMYMKAGIASYKKGNITTSVLAHGLSLEGLIFKTPEGTIKPWPQNWFFADPSSEFQWKGSNQVPMTIYIILVGLASLASVSIVFMCYVHRKATRRQRPSVEEPEIEDHEEDKSTLLGSENQEAEDKE